MKRARAKAAQPRKLGASSSDFTAEWNREDAEDLAEPAKQGSTPITVSSRDWTVETIVRQIENGNIDLDPAFQRRNAWRDDRRSRLIESFVLGFPVPQIVLAENPHERGTFIAIDGKQRLMTIAGFHLPAYRSYWAKSQFSGLKTLSRLNDVPIDDFLTKPEFTSERRRLSNSDIRTTVITGFIDEAVLYDIFYRINTGSVPLSSQELRQVLNRGAFSKFLLETTNDENALWTVLDIESPDARLRDVELLLRLIAWRLFARSYQGNMKPFLDKAMTSLNASWGKSEQSVRATTAEILAGVKLAVDTYGDEIGRKIVDDELDGPLNRAVFEVQAYYFSFPEIHKLASRKKSEIEKGFRGLGADSAFIRSVSATTKSIANYKTRFAAYREMLEGVLKIKIEPTAFGTTKA